jgi:hypothetical protein
MMAGITERFLARVVSNEDPDKRGRIKVVCEEFTGDPDAELPDWIEGAFDWGWFVVPDVDELVEIEVTTRAPGDEVFAQSTILSPQIRWRQKREYHVEEVKAGTKKDSVLPPTPIHEDFTGGHYGKLRGFATPTGHVLLFDDTADSPLINLTWKKTEGESAFYSYVSMSPDGGVIIGNKNGSLVHLDAEGGGITIIDENGNLYNSNAEGIKLIDKFSNIVEMKDGQVQILSQSAISLMGKGTDIKTGTVKIAEGADSPAVRGTEWMTWAAAHTHSTGVGPSGPPITPPPAAILSTQVTLK